MFPAGGATMTQDRCLLCHTHFFADNLFKFYFTPSTYAVFVDTECFRSPLPYGALMNRSTELSCMVEPHWYQPHRWFVVHLQGVSGAVRALCFSFTLQRSSWISFMPLKGLRCKTLWLGLQIELSVIFLCPGFFYWQNIKLYFILLIVMEYHQSQAIFCCTKFKNLLEEMYSNTFEGEVWPKYKWPIINSIHI